MQSIFLWGGGHFVKIYKKKLKTLLNVFREN
jgi:hypothetical protein